MNRSRRRGIVLVSLAVASGGLAASEVGKRSAEVEQRVGPLVPVVAARTALPSGTKLSADKLSVVQVPASYAPPDAFADPAEADGLRTAGALEPGSYVTAGAFAVGPDEERPGNGLARGERAIELRVAGSEALGGLAGAGARVDVLITTEAGDNSGRTSLALEDVELLALRAGGEAAAAPSASDAPGAPSATATLRVTLKQAVYLTAAQNFAREIRLLPRAPGDRRRAGPIESSAGR